MHYQRELIEKLLLPALGITYPIFQNLMDRLMQICRFQHVIKYQEIESPGPSDEGRAWFSIDAMVHSYFYDAKNDIKTGTRIWKRRKMIFFTSCLCANHYRKDIIEMLEPGEIISISYADLFQLTIDFPEIKRKILLISIENEEYYRQRALQFTNPTLHRVQQFIAENTCFMNCTSQEIQCIHLNLSLRSYARYLKMLKGNS